MKAEIPLWKKPSIEQPYRPSDVDLVARNLILDFWEAYSNSPEGEQFREKYDFIEKSESQKKPKDQLCIETTVTIKGVNHHISFMAKSGMQQGKYPDYMKLVIHKTSSLPNRIQIMETIYFPSDTSNETKSTIKIGELSDNGDQAWQSTNTPSTVMSIRNEFDIPLLGYSRAHPKPSISER